MLKRIGIVILVIFIFLLMLWFTNSNPGSVTLDLAFGIVQPSIPLAFSVTFVIGWAFGLFCTSLFILRLVSERRKGAHRAASQGMVARRKQVHGGFDPGLQIEAFAGTSPRFMDDEGQIDLALAKRVE